LHRRYSFVPFMHRINRGVRATYRPSTATTMTAADYNNPVTTMAKRREIEDNAVQGLVSLVADCTRNFSKFRNADLLAANPFCPAPFGFVGRCNYCLCARDDISPVLALLFPAFLEDRLLLLEFFTVEDYLVKLRWLCRLMLQTPAPLEDDVDAVRQSMPLLVYLAAAVSDFFIPRDLLPQHKLHVGDGVPSEQTETDHVFSSRCVRVGTNGSLTVHLSPVPKTLRLLTSVWARDAFVVSFKLETDKEVLLTRAKQALEKYQTHVVVANLLHTRKRELWLIAASTTFSSAAAVSVHKESESCEHISLSPSADIKSEIEEPLIERISELHNLFISHYHNQ
uniref:DFP domain-containing protein n=1 Tax=Schistocephalus solidus TaxID=70667 RepID=A0A183S737_SCHSO